MTTSACGPHALRFDLTSVGVGGDESGGDPVELPVPPTPPEPPAALRGGTLVAITATTVSVREVGGAMSISTVQSPSWPMSAGPPTNHDCPPAASPTFGVASVCCGVATAYRASVGEISRATPFTITISLVWLLAKETVRMLGSCPRPKCGLADELLLADGLSPVPGKRTKSPPIIAASRVAAPLMSATLIAVVPSPASPARPLLLRLFTMLSPHDGSSVL
jgi:hypothetical protein